MMIVRIATLLLAVQAVAFDVASIRLSNSNGIREFQIQGNRLSISGMSLRDLVRRAYLGSDAVQDEARVVGGPAWVATDSFDIVANITGDPGFDSEGRPQRLLQMLKQLLEDRFRLKVHTEPRDTKVYELQIASKTGVVGSGLKRSALDCPVYPQGVPRPAPDPVRWCGVRTIATGASVKVTAQGVTMPELASSLSRFRSIDRLVYDKTSLRGRFDFEIEFVSTLPSTTIDSAPLRPDVGASLFTVLQDRLGIKLQAARAAVEVVVIDSAEHPTPN